MAEHEFYRQEIVIDITGDEQAKSKLRAMDNYLERTSARARKLDKAKVSPTVRMNDRINWPLARALVNMKKLTQKSWKVTLSFKDNISGKLTQLRGKIWSMTKRAITSPLTMLGVGGGLAGITGHSLGLAGEKEQAGIAYETMLGGLKEARKFQHELERFAIKTPFEMPQLRDSTKLLLAYQFEAKKVLPYLRIIGDTASGLSAGAEGIEAIIRALGQMRQTGRVNAQDMMQLTNVGVAAWQILADKMGVSVAKVREMSEKGLIPANKAVEMLLEGMDKGTKHVRGFGGLMDKQSRSMFGIWSTIKDFFNLKIFTRFGEGMSRGLMPGMKRFVDMIEKGDDRFKRMETLVYNLGRTISTKMAGAAEKAFKWFDKITSDAAFKNLDFTGKLTYLITKGVSAATPVIISAGIKIGAAFAKGIVEGMSQAAVDDPKIGAVLGLMMPGPWQVKVGAAASMGIGIPAAKKLADAVKNMQEKAYQSTPTGALETFIQKKQRGESVYIPGTTIGPRHALGGIFSRPHIGLFAEDGAEGIIPLGSKYRRRALDLYARIGHMLGVSQFAAGGITGIQPTFTGAGAGGLNLNIDISGINVIWENNVNEDELALQIGGTFVRKVKETLENRG